MTLAEIVLLSAALLDRPAQEPCAGNASAPALDHVVLVVRDLDAATRAFRQAGFRIKPGRLHANNLLNQHIKFRDGTEIELMTVRGAPGDAMAQDYADLMAAGEGGVYVALRAADLAPVERAAQELGLAVHRSSSGSWRFLSFPASSPAATIFFGSGIGTVQDPDSLVAHAPAVHGLVEAWIEARGIEALLRRLGARHCGPAQSPVGQAGERWALGRGWLVVVPPRSNTRPRVLGVVLRSVAPPEGTRQPASDFWISYRQ